MKFKLIVLYQNQSVVKFYFVLGFLINFYFFRPPGFDCEIVKIWLKTPEVCVCAFYASDLRGLIAELWRFKQKPRRSVFARIWGNSNFPSDLRGLITEL
jgi:hypothetical protein